MSYSHPGMSPAFTWESYRRADGTLDLGAALTARLAGHKPHPRWQRIAEAFVADVEDTQPLRTRVAAELVVAHAVHIATDRR